MRTIAMGMVFYSFFLCSFALHSAEEIWSLNVLAEPGNSLPGDTFQVRVTAVDASGSTIPNALGPVHIVGLVPSDPIGPVLSEIDASKGFVELVNPYDLPITLSGWQLHAIDGNNIYGTGGSWIQFPTNTVLPPRGVLVWAPSRTDVNASLVYTNGSAFPQVTSSGTLVYLATPDGKYPDSCWLNTKNTEIPTVAFSSPVLRPFTSAWSRRGSLNSSSLVDWTAAPSSPGVAHPQLLLPWTSPQTELACEPQEAILVQGQWTGSVRVPTWTQGSITLAARTQNGALGTSTPVTSDFLKNLIVDIPPSILDSSESQTNILGNIRVSIPAPISVPLQIQLDLDAANEFEIANFVVIPAGQISVEIPVLGKDDGVADGDAIVGISLRAPGYRVFHTDLIHRDQHRGRIQLHVGSSLTEDSGYLAYQGTVLLGAPARHRVLVQLTTVSSLIIPSFCVVPRGQNFVHFPLQMPPDSYYNGTSATFRVKAHTGQWPVAFSEVPIFDKQQPSITLEIPAELQEGKSAQAFVRLDIPVRDDLIVPISSSSPRLLVPTNVVILAGQMQSEFSVVAIDNSTKDPDLSINVCAGLSGFSSVCKRIRILDNEVQLSRLDSDAPPPVVLSGDSFTTSARLVNPSGFVQFFSTDGQLIPISPSAHATISSSDTLIFDRGVWSGSIKVEGESSRLQYQLKAAGLLSATQSFEVIKGVRLAGRFTDAAGRTSRSVALTLAPGDGALPPSLLEINAVTATTNRSLPLPADGQLIVLSKHDRFAWITTTNRRVLQVDLDSWSLASQISVPTTKPSPRIEALAPSISSANRLLVVTSGRDGLPVEAALLNQGIQVGATLTLTGVVQKVSASVGRNDNEFFVHAPGYLLKLAASPTGLTVQHRKILPTPILDRSNLDMTDGKLIVGAGFVLDPENLSLNLNLNLNESLGQIVSAIPNSTTQTLLWLESENMRIHRTPIDRLDRFATHRLPGTWRKDSSLFRWGNRGMGYLDGESNGVVFVETSVMDPIPASLALKVEGPTILVQSLEGGNTVPTPVKWFVTVSNSGPVRALSTVISLSDRGSVELGDLDPGETRIHVVEDIAFRTGTLIIQAMVTSWNADTATLHQKAQLRTEIHPITLPGFRSLILGHTDLVADPSQDRLYVTVSTNAGAAQNGIAIVDPQHATVDQFVPVEFSPHKVKISSNGKSLFCVLDTNRIIQWNLPSFEKVREWSIEKGEIIDILPLGSDGGRLAVLSTGGVQVYEQAILLPRQVSTVVTSGQMSLIGQEIWVTMQENLQHIHVIPDGAFEFSRHVIPPESVGSPFASDGKWLHFGQNSFDSTTLQFTSTEFLGVFPVYDASNHLLVTRNGINFESYSLPDLDLLERASYGAGWLVASEKFWLWGRQGVAFSAGPTLVIGQTQVRKSGPAADLALSIIPPSHGRHGQLLDWNLVVTNASSSLLTNVYVEILVTGAEDLPLLVPPTGLVERGRITAFIQSIPAQSNQFIQLRIIPIPGQVDIHARIIGTQPDSAPQNNEAAWSGLFSFHPGDPVHLSLTMETSSPTVASHEPFEVVVTLRNQGISPATVTSLNLSTLPVSNLTLLETHCEGCTVQNDVVTWDAPLPPGETRRIVLKWLASIPGIYNLIGAFYTLEPLVDPNSFHTDIPLLVRPDPAVAAGNFDFQTDFSGWALYLPLIQRVILPASSPSPHAFLIHPETFLAEKLLHLPALPTQILATDNDQFLWMLSGEQSVFRVRLDTGNHDLQFIPNAPGQVPGAGTRIATVPGHPDDLLVAQTSDQDQGWVISRYRNGLPLGTPLLLPNTFNGSCEFFEIDSQRIWFRSGVALREILVSADAMTLGRVMDGSLVRDETQKVVGRSLVSSSGRVLDAETLAVTEKSFGNIMSAFETDSVNGLLYWETESPRQLGIFQGPKLEAAVNVPNKTVSSFLASMGIHGLMRRIDGILSVIRTQPLLHSPANPRLSVNVPAEHDLLKGAMTLTVTLSNASPRVASEAKLRISVPDELGQILNQDGSRVPSWEWNLGNLGTGSNLVLQVPVLPITGGTLKSITTFSTSTPVVNPGILEIVKDSEIIPAPWLVFPQTSLVEGGPEFSRGIFGFLSRSSPSRTTIPYTAEDITTGPQDLLNRAGGISISTGQRIVAFNPVRGDFLQEPSEQFAVNFGASPIDYAASNLVITILDDDLVGVGFTNSNVSLLEGPASLSQVAIPVVLNEISLKTVKVKYATASLGARPGLDYPDREGWLEFAPGETLKEISIPLLGNTETQANRSFVVYLKQTENARVLLDSCIITLQDDDRNPLRIQLTMDNPGFLILQFPSEPGRTYRLEVSESIRSPVWKQVETTLQGSGSALSWRVNVEAEPGAHRFYRVISPEE